MIEIYYDPRKLYVTLKGHAGAGVPGQDLICCAASAITYTLAANIRRMQKRGWLKKARIRLAPGDAEIICTPCAKAQEAVRCRVEAVCLGFAMLAQEYPEFVCFRAISR